MAAAFAATAMPALAADMDNEVIFTDDANFVKPAELGSGWYLRGDVTYNFNLQQERGFSYNPNVGLPSLQFRYGESVGFGVGAGKQFNSWLRGDVTFDRPVWASQTARNGRSFSGRRSFQYSYTPGGATEPVIEDALVVIRQDTNGNFSYGNDCAGAGAAQCNASAAGLSFPIGGTEEVTTEKSVWSVLANAYMDLPTFSGFTPYVGAGIGAARPAVNVRHIVNCVPTANEACGFPTGTFGQPIQNYELVNDTYARWLPTFAVSAGASYDLTKNIKLDLGYKFQHIMNINSVLAGSNVDPSLLNDVENVHSVKLGFRVTAW